MMGVWKGDLAMTKEPKTKRYLRKRQLSERYQCTTRTVDRMSQDGRLPAPDFYSGKMPMWDEAKVEAAERAAVRTSKQETGVMTTAVKTRVCLSDRSSGPGGPGTKCRTF
jgi:predicted DNA-binding transcriptional regulator AlpA